MLLVFTKVAREINNLDTTPVSKREVQGRGVDKCSTERLLHESAATAAATPG